MSTLKKLLALTLALAMVLSVSVFAGNYSADTYADADKINEDCKDAVEVMYALENDCKLEYAAEAIAADEYDEDKLRHGRGLEGLLDRYFK